MWLCGHEHIELSESVTTPDGSKTYVSESGHYLNSVGLIDLNCTMDEDGSVHVDYEKTSVDYEEAQNYPKDASVTAVLDTIKAENETALNRVIGTSPVELDGVWEHIRIGQTNLGNVITDAYLLATGADIAFENAGGIRASIAAGTVTYGDVINVSPYGNYVVTKKLTGAQIKEMLESSLTIQKTVLLQTTVVSGMRGQMTAEVICRLVELSSVLIRRSRRVSVCFLCKKMGRSWMIQKSIP